MPLTAHWLQFCLVLRPIVKKLLTPPLMTWRGSAKRSGTKSILRCVQTWCPTTRNLWPLWLPTRVLPLHWKCKSMYNFLKWFFVVVLSLTVKINLTLNVYTDHFFVSGQTYKISRGSNICFPHCIWVSFEPQIKSVSKSAFSIWTFSTGCSVTGFWIPSPQLRTKL